jgi:peptide/nickel transport system substrate-binding protein
MKKKSFPLVIVIIIIIISACSVSKPKPINSANQPTQEPSRSKTLTICLGEEPDSLYLYNANTPADNDVLQAIYDGPFDTLNGSPKPIILENIPNLKDGSTSISPININSGDPLINTAGELVSLEAGVKIFPSGCTDLACAITWDGSSPIKMDSITAIFKLKPNLKWSDGRPLNASDSVFSFRIASDPTTPGNKIAINQTADYSTSDDLTVMWVSKPGLVTDDFEKYFWTPLPEHAWGKYSANDLLSSTDSVRTPIGWGAYKIEEWIEGKSIRLVKNPFYFRSDEGLPYFDTLIFKIINPTGSAAISNLKFDRAPFQQFDFALSSFDKEISENGCDLTSTSLDLRNQLSDLNILQNYFKDPAIEVLKSSLKETNLLFFNLRPDAPKSAQSLSNPEVRKAIRLCLDKEKVIKDLSFGFYDLINTLDLAPSPDQNEITNSYHPDEGKSLLDQSGWKVKDNHTGSSRISVGVAGIPDGQELNFSYLVEDSSDNLKAAEIFKTSLGECGIRISIIAAQPEIFWNSAHKDSIFQGHYDMAQFSWADPIPNPCLLFSSQYIPNSKNNFLGTNFSGYSSQEIDNDCNILANSSLKEVRNDLRGKMGIKLKGEIPAIPLYSYSKLLIAQKDFCSSGINAQSRNEFNQIESFKISPTCP